MYKFMMNSHCDVKSECELGALPPTAKPTMHKRNPNIRPEVGLDRSDHYSPTFAARKNELGS